MATIIGKNKAGETLDQNDGVTQGNDVIIGNAGSDKIYGLGGHDIMKGGGGADLLDGGDGNDTVSYEDSEVGVEVSLKIGKGAKGTADGDTLKDVENLFGSQHDDILVGDDEGNKLEGADGNDILKGGGGADKLLGGEGDDDFHADGIDDFFDGGEGNDTLVLSEAHQGMSVHLGRGYISEGSYGQGGYPAYPKDIVNVENVTGSAYDDFLAGGGGDNTLIGRAGDDRLYGAYGNDVLQGGLGEDLINGGKGADSLTGGEDADTFVFWADDSFVVGGKAQDTIEDFKSGTDKLDLSSLEFDLADLLTLNQSIAGVNVSTFGIDANNNGAFDNGEFAITVKMDGSGFLSSGDLIL